MSEIAREIEGEEDEISEIHTACNSCLFAEYVDVGETSTQVGCKVGQLDFYREKGIKIVEAYDNKSNFYIINDKICTKRRADKWKHKDKVLVEQIKEVNKEIVPSFDIVIYMDKNSTLDDLKTTLESINTSNYPIVTKLTITIINNFAFKKSDKVIPILRKMVDDIPWRIETILQKDYDVYRTIDIASKKFTKQFHTVFRAGYLIDSEFFSSIDRAINEELIQCCVVRPQDDINGLTVLNVLHKQLVGNRNGTILEKVEELELTDKGVFKLTELTLN